MDAHGQARRRMTSAARTYLGPLIHLGILVLLTLLAAPALLVPSVDEEGVDLFSGLALLVLTASGLPWSLPLNMFTPVADGAALESPVVLVVVTVASALVNLLVHVLVVRRRTRRGPTSAKRPVGLPR